MATGSATISWATPSLNADGSSLANITGYRVRYGTSTSNLAQAVDVAGSTTTSTVIGGLSSGTYYFSVLTVNTLGVLSSPSNLVSKAVP